MHKLLVVFLVDFEECLGMCGDGADLRCGGAGDQVTAVAAFPHHDTGLLKDSLGLDVVQQCAIALLVGLLNGSDATELGSQSGKAQGLYSYKRGSRCLG